MAKREALDVFNLRYMKKTRFSLNCIGIWPNKVLGDISFLSHVLSILNLIMIGIAMMLIFSEIMYIKVNPHNFDFLDLGHTYITVVIMVVFTQRLTLSMQKSFSQMIKTFVFHFHLEHFKHLSDYSAIMNHRVNRICKVFTIFCHYQMYLGLSLFNLVPLYKNYTVGMYTSHRPVNSTFEHSAYYYFPIDQYTDPVYYTVVAIANWFVSYIVSCTHCCVDLLITIIVVHIWGHLSILKHDLEDFPRPKPQMSNTFQYTEEENNDVFQRLKYIIKYHEMIKIFMSKTSRAYGGTLCLYYAYHQIVESILLLECSAMNAEALGKYGVLTLITFQQLIQLSVVFELIGSKGHTLINAVYGLPWEFMDTRNRRLVLLLLQNVQKPLALKAGDIVPVGVTTMAAVLKTSLSYFMMLKTLGNTNG